MRSCGYRLSIVSIASNLMQILSLQLFFHIQCYGIPRTECTYSLTFVLSIHAKARRRGYPVAIYATRESHGYNRKYTCFTLAIIHVVIYYSLPVINEVGGVNGVCSIDIGSLFFVCQLHFPVPSLYTLLTLLCQGRI